MNARRWMVGLLAAVMLVAGGISVAQAQVEGQSVAPDSGRYTLTIPEGWASSTTLDYDISAFVGESLRVGESRAAMEARELDDSATGATLWVDLYALAIFRGANYNIDAMTDAELLALTFGAAGGGVTAASLDVVTVSGYPAASVRFSDPTVYNLPAGSSAGGTAVLVDGLIVFMTYAAPDGTGLDLLEEIAATFSLTDAGATRDLTVDPFGARPPLKLDGGVVNVPLGANWLVMDWYQSLDPFTNFDATDTDTPGSLPRSYFILPEMQRDLLDIAYTRSRVINLPGVMVHITAMPYDFAVGGADVAVDDARRLDVLAETAARLGATYDADAVSQSSVGLSPVLSVPVDGVFGGSNRGILTLIDASYKLYSIVVAGPEDMWEADYAAFAGDMMTALSVNPALPTLTDGPVPTGLQMGLLAPDFTVSLLDGGRVALSDFRGRPVVLTFWATWCPPCREEMPVFAEIAAERDDIVFFAVDNRETAAQVAAFRDAFGMGFPIGLDPSGTVGDMYNVIYLPTTLVLDAEGIIRYIPREVDNIQRADVMGWLAFAGVE